MTGHESLSEGVRALLKTAADFLPIRGLGVVREDGPEHLVLTYCDPFGATAYRLPARDAPPSIRPRPAGARTLTASELEANPRGAVESRLLHPGFSDDIRQACAVREVLTLPVPETTCTLLLLGLAQPGTLTSSQESGIASLATGVLDFLRRTELLQGEVERLRRLEAVDALLPAMFKVLDVREIFDQLSSITKEVLRHDFASLGIFHDERTQIEMYVQTAEGPFNRYSGPMPFAPAQTTAFLYRVIDDLTIHPLERDMESVKAGGRSSLRVAIRHDDEILGALNFTSRDPAPYTAVDLAVSRRIADYAALALSHQRLAEDSRRAAALQERAANLQMLDGLLNAFTGSLDVREVFDRISNVAQQVLPHDMIALPLVSDDKQSVIVYAAYDATGQTVRFPEVEPISDAHRPLLESGWDYVLYDDILQEPTENETPPARFGLRSLLRVAVRLEREVLGVLDFASFTPGFYKPADALIGRRIADHIALTLSHQHLSDENRRAAALQERAANLAMLDGLLATLTSVLDLRDVFDRVAKIAHKVMAHDAMAVARVDRERGTLSIFASSGFGDALREYEIPIPDPRLIDGEWESLLIDDLLAHPVYSDMPSARAGMRSLLGIPIRFDGTLAASVNFFSRATGYFSRDDVLVARRISDHIALALSHQRLADESRRAAALQERAANLEMLDGMLDTLTGVLDIREVFPRVSDVAQPALPHDGMSISLIEGEDRVRMYAARGLGDQLTLEMPLPDRSILTDPWDHQLIEDLAGSRFASARAGFNAGMESVLIVPVRLGGRLHGSVNFFSRRKGRFSREDVVVGRRIADHIGLALSHERLAEEVRRTGELKARTANLELLDDLLQSVTDAADLSESFDRISAIARKALAHDALVLPVLLADGRRVRMYATMMPGSAPFPESMEIPESLRTSDWEYSLVDDLQADPVQRNFAPAKLGYRSALRVPIRFDGQLAAGLGFFSFTPALYKHADILVARRIADRLALSLVRERGVAASKRADEATERAARLESRVRELTNELDARTGYRRVIGNSPQWSQVLTQAMQVASTETTVLLLGESGTGKEVIARFLHRASTRKGGPFIALNCAALPEQLLEAELFGYERGAFTGAVQSKPGQLEQASGGMLFLDEVGEMSPSAQAKFLRVLQEREFQRLGGTRVLRTDARIVAATNRDLPRAIAHGQFREDLYYRLNVFAIRLPPLRERRDDVLPLSDAFVAEIGKGLGRPPAGISRDARKMLIEYRWPGNVRELRNILERAAILCDGGLITAEHLALTTPAVVPPAAPASTGQPAAAAASTPARPSSAGDLRSMERAMIEQALQDARFNKSKAAKALGLTRQQLYVRMRRYGLE